MPDRTDIPLALTYDDVLLEPGPSDVVPANVQLGTQLSSVALSIPLLSAAMDTVTEGPLAIALARLGGLGVIHRNFSPAEQAEQVAAVKAATAAPQTGIEDTDSPTPPAVDSHGRLRVAAAIGASEGDVERLDALVEAGVDLVVIDTAHGHSRGVLNAVARAKKRHPLVPLVAGNVATEQGTIALAEAGADVIKVGVGPGSICTTRVVAGVGVPQLTAVMACVRGAARYGKCVIADGGIQASGDIVKALAAGAQAVMVGSLFAGTDESPGKIIERDGRRFKACRGMGSLGAMRAGSADRYFQSGRRADKLVPEGVEAHVPYRGALAPIVHRLTGGVRAGMGYVGAATLTDLRPRARFVRITTAGLRESLVHDVVSTLPSPDGE